MIKYIFVIGLFAALSSGARCQQKDTTVTYMKYGILENYKVKTLDSADYIRLVFKSGDINEDPTVTEFYKDGHTKLMGKLDHFYYFDKRNGYEKLTGDCITFFPNGKRKASMTYGETGKVGDEYLFYPNGRVYCYIKHTYPKNMYSLSEAFNWECYDQNGAKICSEGNGHWLLFNDNFKLLLEGEVKKGRFEGDWHGATLKADSIKYIYKFKDGNIVSGIGYDKWGKAYPFIHDVETPSYKVGRNYYEVSPFVFVRILKHNLKVPMDANGNKMNLDTAHIAFTIERDGTLTNAEIIGNTEPEIKAVLKDALDKSGIWSPRTYFGLPVKSRITLSYKAMADFKPGVDKSTMKYEEEMLGFNLENGYVY